MKQFERGQIWLVNFDPSFGHEYRKVRPALIIQNSRYIKPGNLLTIIPISSQTEKQAELDILIETWGHIWTIDRTILNTYSICQ